MTTFYEALRNAKTPLDFIHAVADQPLIDDPDGPPANDIDEQELIDERHAIIEKAREFQGATGIWLVEMADLVDTARRILLGLEPKSGTRADAIAGMERIIDKLRAA